MIPSAAQAWRPLSRLPLAMVHPAARLGAGFLAVLSALLWPLEALPVLVMLLGWLMVRAGLCLARLRTSLRPWLIIALFVLVIHTVTATDVVALGHPSWVGAGRGAIALLRLTLMLASSSLVLRLLPLDELIDGVAWWLRPLGPLGVDTQHLGITLAVALGTAPRTQAEAVRIQACLRLRRADGSSRRRGLHLRERLMVIPPLMEGLARRAESLPLALAGRLPATSPEGRKLPWWQGLILVGWSLTLIWAVFL